MNNPPNESARFVTCPCQHCNGTIEFDASGFQQGETQSVDCPHCHLETLIYVPPSQKLSPIPTPVVQPKIYVQPLKQPKSFLEIISILCLVAFFGWTALCGLGLLIGLLAEAQSESVNPVITSNDQMSRTFGTIGFVMGLGMWFAIWLFGAVPTFMIWIMTRKK